MVRHGYAKIYGSFWIFAVASKFDIYVAPCTLVIIKRKVRQCISHAKVFAAPPPL